MATTSLEIWRPARPRTASLCAFRRGGGTGEAAQRKRAARLPCRRPASRRPRPRDPGPAPHLPRPRRRRPREPCRDAPHCLRGGSSPRAPAARAQSGRRPRPRPGLAPPPPFVDAGQAGAVGCAAAAPGPGSEAPGGEEEARPGSGPCARRRPAVGLRRPRPARPSRALDRSVPLAGEGFSPGRGPRPALVVLEAGHRPPVPLPARAYSAARPCQPATLALLAPGRCPAPPALAGDPARLHSPGSRGVNLGVPDASVCPRPRTTTPTQAPFSPGRFTGGGQSALGPGYWHPPCPVGRVLPILEGLRLSRVLFLI